MAEAHGSSEKILSQESYGFLAQANLMRVRGQWDEAVALCMKAMERDPDNASVHSMLGDIYENQGKLDEAVRWYNLALDKNPSSPADRLKLSHIAQEFERNAVNEAPGLLMEDAWTDLEHRPERPKSVNQKNLTLILRISAYILAAAFAMVVAYALSIPMPHGPRSVPLQTSPNMPTTSFVLQPDSSQASSSPAAPRDQAEQSLLTALSGDAALTDNGVTVTDLSDDPRTGQITVTALYAPVDEPSPTQADIMRAALRTATEASARTEATSATAFTVRILLQNAGAQTDSLSFAGDVSRSTLLTITGDPAGIPDDQLTSKFTNPWWASGYSS